MKPHNFGHIVILSQPTCEYAWWTEAPRDHFYALAKQEEPRMRQSKAYLLVGDPPVVGQISDKRVEKKRH